MIWEAPLHGERQGRRWRYGLASLGEGEERELDRSRRSRDARLDGDHGGGPWPGRSWRGRSHGEGQRGKSWRGRGDRGLGGGPWPGRSWRGRAHGSGQQGGGWAWTSGEDDG